MIRNEGVVMPGPDVDYFGDTKEEEGGKVEGQSPSRESTITEVGY